MRAEKEGIIRSEGQTGSEGFEDRPEAQELPEQIGAKDENGKDENEKRVKQARLYAMKQLQSRDRRPGSPGACSQVPGQGVHLLCFPLGTPPPLWPTPALTSLSHGKFVDHNRWSAWNTVCTTLSVFKGASDNPQQKSLGPTARS